MNKRGTLDRKRMEDLKCKIKITSKKGELPLAEVEVA